AEAGLIVTATTALRVTGGAVVAVSGPGHRSAVVETFGHSVRNYRLKRPGLSVSLGNHRSM
ncbi:hypothetical protein, partial [Micromonospora sp. Rc5]|uniref:hypothetical protein n=1 Tax=Micromonospora sp. Rc5 TaxID=1920666 RepID=UPI001E39F851